MSWWSEKLHTPAPDVVQQTVSDAQPPAPWWAPQPTAPTPRSEPVYAPQSAYPDPHAQPATPAPSKARSARITSTCPECGSDNYYAPSGTNSMVKCFECGYNPRFGVQSGAGGGLPSENSGPATASKQVSTSNNFNPTTIIGNVG